MTSHPETTDLDLEIQTDDTILVMKRIAQYIDPYGSYRLCLPGLKITPRKAGMRREDGKDVLPVVDILLWDQSAAFADWCQALSAVEMTVELRPQEIILRTTVDREMVTYRLASSMAISDEWPRPGVFPEKITVEQLLTLLDS